MHKKYKKNDGKQKTAFGAKKKWAPKQAKPKKENDGSVRLNKYISNAGICSRREADTLIETGAVKVNGKVVTKLGTRVMPSDHVSVGDQRLKTEKLVYILLNKPKDYLTTSKDPKNRKTVMQLVAGQTKQRVYPVGRLERNTTGLILLTNDGEFTTKITSTKYAIKKIYYVHLDKNFRKADFEKLTDGMMIAGVHYRVDEVSFLQGKAKSELGIEVHHSSNKAIKLMLEKLGYNLLKLDRVAYGELTKKNILRGKFRYLNDKEIRLLKMSVYKK